MLRLTKVLVAGAAVLALAACGSAEVASPGEGDFGGGNGGGGGGGGTPGAGTPAADCPAGLVNIGTVANNTLRACQLPATITGALQLSVRAGTIYAISGKTQVGIDLGPNPAAPVAGGVAGQLTIDPGVKIFARATGDYLVINRGSKIFAEGTATNPIIFTSAQDVEGQNTNASQQQWGGVLIAGRAPIATCPAGVTAPNIACVAITEGTPDVLHGGVTPTDDSGRMRYFQIKYSGFPLFNNVELQSLTLAGVGSGTTIEYFQSYNSSDDGVEIFGGNVNLRYVVINGADDDGIDTDTGYRGAIQFAIVTQRPTIPTSGGRALEWSAAPSGTTYYSQPKISNLTVVGRNAAVAADSTIVLNTGTTPTIINSVFTNPTTSASACLDLDDAQTVANGPIFRSVFFSCARPFEEDTNVGAAAIATLFASATNVNNVANGVATLTAPAGATITNSSLNFINGANETAVPVTAAPAVNAFFQNVTYIGAVRNASDTWYLGWTCGLAAGSNC
jgi:hypothetical protein